MSPVQRPPLPKPDTTKVLLSRGLAIVLRRSLPPMTTTNGQSRKKNNNKSRKEASPHGTLNSASPQYSFDQRCQGCQEISDCDFAPGFGPESVFGDWVRENGECFWNPCLVQSVKGLEFRGFVRRPTTLIVGGTDYALEVVRSAYGRRMLRPPTGYDIVMLGDLDPLTLSLVSQTQFAPLPEALCKVVYDLTSEGCIASLQVIAKKLKTTFPEIMVPSEDLLYKTLGTLIKERKLYHTGSGYSVVTPDTFRLLAMSPPLERQMLLTNEEAIVRLHGSAADDGRTACTQTAKEGMLTAWSSAERIVEPRKQGASLGKLKRSHSLKLLRSRDREKLSRSNSFKSTGTSPGPHQDYRTDHENGEPVKKEKSPSMFSKWFRRGRSEKSRSGKSKGTTSQTSTQFPPTDWSDPDYALFNSRATQTLSRSETTETTRTKIRSSSLTRPSSRDRHSFHLSSTPATPRAGHRSSQRSSDLYHCRSSSLSRSRHSPSPKRDVTPKQVVPVKEEPVKIRPRYESPFSPFTARKKAQSLLMANEQYNTSYNHSANNGLHQNHPNNTSGKVMPYQSTDILKSHPSFGNPPPEKKLDTLSGWRRPVSMFSSFNNSNNATNGTELNKVQPSVRVIPRLSFPPVKEQVSAVPSVVPSTKTTSSTTTTKTIVSNVKSSETITKTVPMNGKEMRLGTTVDVEISVGNRNPLSPKTLLTTDLDSNPVVRNDLLKIATTWNQSIKSDAGKATSSGIPKLTTTTNITTSLSHNRGCKDDQKSLKVKACGLNGVPNLNSPVLKRTSPLDCTMGRDSPSKDTVCSSSPRSTLTSDAKSEFFSECDPNSTMESHVSKDDSGFSSSTSTSRPMSVSPC